MEQELICAGVALLLVFLASIPVAIIALVVALKTQRQVRELVQRSEARAAREGLGPQPEAPPRVAPVPVVAPPRAEKPEAPRPAPAAPVVGPVSPAAPAAGSYAGAGSKAAGSYGAAAGSEAPPPRPPLAAPAAPAWKPIKWEELIGLKLLAWAGIIVVLVGVAFFIKYGYDQGWFGKHPWVRVAIPLGIGLVLLGIGEFLSHKVYRVLARVCTGGGLAALYWGAFTAWARFEKPLVSEPAAWIFMVAITAVAILLAVRYASLVVAILSLVGGLAAPILIRPERDPGHVLFLYLAALNVGVLALAYFKKWRVLNLLAMAGTILNVIVWLYSHYWVQGQVAAEKLGFVVAYLTVLWAIYFALSIVYHLLGRRGPSALDLPLTLVNAVGYFLALYVLLKDQYHHWLGPAAVILGAAYLVEGLIVKRRAPGQVRFVLLQIGQALGLATLAIPIQLSGVFIPMAWAVEACVVYWIGLRLKDWRLRVVGLLVHASSIVALVYYADVAWDTKGMLVLNSRTATFAAVALAMALSAWLFRRQADRPEAERPVMAVAAGLAHGLLMILIGVEVYRWHADAYAATASKAAWDVSERLRELAWARDAIAAFGLAAYGLLAVGLVAVLRRAFHHAAALAAVVACFFMLVQAETVLPALKGLAGWNPVGAAFAGVAGCLALAAVVSRYVTPEGAFRRQFAIAYELLALGVVLGLYLTEVSRAAHYAGAGGLGRSLPEVSVTALRAAGFAVMAGLVLLRGLWAGSLAHRAAGLAAMVVAVALVAYISVTQQGGYQTILWQPRGVAFLLLAAVMALAAAGYTRRMPKASPERMMVWPVLAVLVHVVVLACFTLEAEDFWAARASVWFPNEEVHAWYARQATLSVGYALYAFALLAVGIRRRRAMLRILALVILGGTLGKVMLLDLSRLEAIWRILSLAGLGVLLLAASFLYYKYRHIIFGAEAAGKAAKESSDAKG
jgi:uncharacterized membrane protein